MQFVSERIGVIGCRNCTSIESMPAIWHLPFGQAKPSRAKACQARLTWFLESRQDQRARTTCPEQRRVRRVSKLSKLSEL